MAETAYDRHAAFYVDFVDRWLANEGGHLDQLLHLITTLIGDRLHDARVADVCCGEGYAGRFLATRGASEIIGIDISSALITRAKERADSPKLSYRVDDAQKLGTLEDGAFDVAVSQLAMMDVPDHRAIFAAVRRVLKPEGVFAFSMLHPCFKGRAFHVRDAPEYLTADDGEPIAVSTRCYATEGHFNSGGDGVRGRVGSYHRTISTYVNDLLAAGFTLERLEEPITWKEGEPALFKETPTHMVFAARAV